MTYVARARVIRAGVSEAEAKGLNFQFDSGAEQSQVLAGPAEILCTAFAACVLKNVSRFSELLTFECEGASIVVTAERGGEPPRITRITYDLVLQTSETAHRIELMRKNIEKFGTIYNTLASACEVSGMVRPAAPSS